ncbi:D-aminoacyl-tRNA deacylase, partial [Candidatus Woesearchaeota archaeon]|nr:D-aminoacyl-tRNA deacylase [Candidatus Woesearchaeota archaeon]
GDIKGKTEDEIEREIEGNIKEKIGGKADPDLIIFASRHVSSAGKPSLSCHIAGNWNEAKFGGKAGKLCVAPAIVLKEIFLELHCLAKRARELEKPFNHEITLEATHHGPLVEKPSLFVEIGSDEEEWAKKENGKIIASALVNALGKMLFIDRKRPDEKWPDEKKYEVAVGIGGPHYCNTFNAFQLNARVAVGHICPKYALEHLNAEMLQQAWERTIPKPDFFLLDWKGLGKEKQRVLEILKTPGHRVERSDQIKNNLIPF